MQFFVILYARVEWVNDVLIIPLFGDVDTVKYQPEAKLYVNDFWVVGAKVTYERNGVEWTYLSTVNTAYVRQYVVKYRAYFPDYNLYDVHPITFSVVDQIPPTIIKADEMTVAVGEKMPDLKQALVVTDNYYAKEQLSIVVDTSGVNMSRVGDYKINYRISDPSGNITLYETMFHVVDHMPPSLTLNKPIIVSVFGSWSWQSFITVKDNVDTILHVDIDDRSVRYDVLGTYIIHVSVTDRSGNRTTEQLILEVKDMMAPVLQLRTKAPIIPIYSVIDRGLLESYIITVYDNYDELHRFDVNITHDIDSHIIGQYKIIYRISDHSGNETQAILNVSIADLTPPTIELLNPLLVDVFSVEPFWLTYFRFSDNLTSPEKLTTKLTTSVKMNVVGQYPISIDVTDGAGNVGMFRGYIEVIDRIPPNLIQRSDVIITDFMRKPLEHYFVATDQYDSSDKLIIIIDDDDVHYEVIGIYQGWCTAKDRYGNQTTIPFDVVIIDQSEPVLTLKKNVIQHDWGSAIIDFREWIHDVSDNYDTLTKDDVLITHDVDWQHLGRYEVTYMLMDQSKNITYVQLVCIIDDRISPTIQFDDLTIMEGDLLDLWEGVDMYDNYRIAEKYVFPGSIDTTQPGRYTVTYIVLDERGNYTSRDRLITIEPQSQSYTLSSFLPMAIIVFIGGAILYILYKRG
jgi:hypothetical protein